MTAEQVQDVAAKGGGLRFSTALDGYFLPKHPTLIFEAGQQARVPLLAGSNSEEQGARSVLGATEPTPENFANAVRKLYGDRAGEVLKVYAASTPEEVLQAATDLASDRFISHGTWQWTELQMKTGGKPVYRYYYTHPRPSYLGMPGQAPPSAAPAAGRGGPAAPRGAAHSAEIQYAMGNLSLDKRYAWEPADSKVSETMQGYFVNFIKTGNPNGPGLPNWPAYDAKTNYQRMRIDEASRVESEPHRARYLVLDAVAAKP
jgi:para-nitrobenzyl esterase